MKSQGRPRVRGICVSITAEEEKFLFGLGEKHFLFIVNKGDCLVQGGAIVSDSFYCFVSECYYWHECKCDSYLCILMTYSSLLVLLNWMWFSFMVNLWMVSDLKLILTSVASFNFIKECGFLYEWLDFNLALI